MDNALSTEALLLMQKEISVRCPFCAQNIEVLIDMSVTSQNYLEDCSVCCRPIQFEVTIQNGELEWVDLQKGS